MIPGCRSSVPARSLGWPADTSIRPLETTETKPIWLNPAAGARHSVLGTRSDGTAARVLQKVGQDSIDRGHLSGVGDAGKCGCSTLPAQLVPMANRIFRVKTKSIIQASADFREVFFLAPISLAFA